MDRAAATCTAYSGDIMTRTPRSSADPGCPASPRLDPSGTNPRYTSSPSRQRRQHVGHFPGRSGKVRALRPEWLSRMSQGGTAGAQEQIRI